MTEVLNLQALRAIVGTAGELYYARGYNLDGDGGGGVFMWRIDETSPIYVPIFTGTGIYSQDNDGTIVKTTGNDTGRWVRQYDGYINILWFGALGFGNDYTTHFQKAIDYASLNSKLNPLLKSSTIFIPNGSYKISHVILKNGVTILGDSFDNTIIYALPGGLDNQYIFTMENGVVNINISNLNLSGQDTLRGAFYFESKPQTSTPFHGGLMNSRISNIFIYGFKGHGIYLDGGGFNSNHLLPNQFNIFENVRIFNFSDNKNALKIDGQQGQITFLNCEFDGYKTEISEDVFDYKKGKNVHIQNIRQYISAVISFINCTCQDSDYGFLIEWAENITIDNCWFENLGVSVMVKSNHQDPPDNDMPCRSINILNNRFANAAGFGSLNAPNNVKLGQCVAISNSFVNVNNNYVAVSDTEGEYLNVQSSFIIASNNEKGGVSAEGNTFQINELGKTFGIMQLLTPNPPFLDCAGHKLVFVDGSSKPVINILQSSINAGEYLAIRVEQGVVTFENTDNIAFRTNSPTFSFSLFNGEIATFVKVDNFVGTNYETYQLVSIMNIL